MRNTRVTLGTISYTQTELLAILKMNAGSGGSLMIGGSTRYDASVPALLGLLSEWSRQDRDYESRIHDLFGDGNGLNGANILNPSAVMMDSAIDQFFDGAGDDWSWLRRSATAPVQIHGFSAGNAATQR